jgi:predicted membrane channel-forming protein YqfA (hemolysin III family)
MKTTLQKRFVFMLTPAMIGFGCVLLLRSLGIDPIEAKTMAGWVPVLFVLAVVTAAAAPIMVRAAFAHRMHRHRRTSQAEFFRFQHALLIVVMATPYLALAVYTLAAPAFYLGGALLAMLYALYYHYPSEKRIDFDRRVFRVQ